MYTSPYVREESVATEMIVCVGTVVLKYFSFVLSFKLKILENL